MISLISYSFIALIFVVTAQDEWVVTDETDITNSTLIEGPPKFVVSTRSAMINDELALEIGLYLDGVDDSAIYSQGRQGIYLRLLLDQNEAGYWDGVTCVLTLTGAETDSFTCYDQTFTTVDATPTLDTVDDLYHWTEDDIVTPYTVSGVPKRDYGVTIYRAYDTEDTEDAALEEG